MSQNMETPVEVFRGTLSLPSSPSLVGRPDWSAANTVEIPFSTPYSYTGGNLCVEIDGTGTVNWWPIDMAFDPVIGAVGSIGASCEPLADLDGTSAYVAPEDLVVGETARFVARGEPGAQAFMLMGILPLPSPVDLTVLGAPGCFLYVDAVSMSATTFHPPEIAGLAGLANILLPIPPQANLLGAKFYTQWVGLGTSLRTSNADECTIASSLPQLGMSVVVRDRPLTETDVGVTMAPVLRFELQ